MASAEVISITGKSKVDAAWADYQKHAQRAFADRTLLLNRGFMEEWARLEARFKKLSLMPRAY
jgi:hypothetical protein